MTDAMDRALVDVDPVPRAVVRDLTGPAAREALLVALTGPRTYDTPATGAVPTDAGGRPWLPPVLMAAAVAAVLLATGVWGAAGGPDRSYEDVWAAAPSPAARDACPVVGRPELDSPTRGTGIADVRGASTFCAHVDVGDGSGEDSGSAWSVLGVAGGPPTLRITYLVERVEPPAAGAVVVLGSTSDAFAVDAERPDADPLPTHQVVGLAGDGVTAVQVLLPDGTGVTATLADGVWGLWWPAGIGAVDTSRVRVVTADGERTVGLDEVRLPDEGGRSWFQDRTGG